MPEKKELIKTIHTKMMCDCGGEMQVIVYGANYITLKNGNGKEYIHRCDKCQKQEAYPKIYPYDKPLEE